MSRSTPSGSFKWRTIPVIVGEFPVPIRDFLLFFFPSELMFFVEAVLGSRVRDWLQRRSARAGMLSSMILFTPPIRAIAIAPGLRARLPKSISSTAFAISNRCRNVPDFDLPVRCRRSRTFNSRPATLLRASHFVIVHRPGTRRRLGLFYAQACDWQGDAI